MAILISVGIIYYTSCVIISNAPTKPREPADHSFTVIGERIESGNITSVLERSLGKSAPSLQADILLKGVVTQPFFSVQSTFFLRTIKLKYQDDDTNWILPETRRTYQWVGMATIDNIAVETLVEFYVFSDDDRGGGGKQFILTNASWGQVRIEAEDPLDVYNTEKRNFPYMIGNARIANNNYRIFAVLDNAPNDLWDFHTDVFFNPRQKFQFLGAGDTVVAELEGGRYTIYNTLPETERTDIKRAISLFVGFRHSTSVLQSINNNWNPPSFYRYVYP